MISRDDRPLNSAERRAQWYAKAAKIDGYLMTGPRFMADFDRIFARQYEAEAIADSAPSAEDVAFVEACVKRYGDEVDWTAWQRIRAQPDQGNT